MTTWNGYTVEYRNGSTWTAISNPVALRFDVGRQISTDAWNVSTGTIRVYYPTGYSSPISNLSVGTMIRWFAPGRTTVATWTGYVSNLTVQVDKPWNSGTGTGVGDFLVIECEGELAKLARTDATLGTALPSVPMGTAIGALNTASSAFIFQSGWFFSSFTVTYDAGTYQALQHANTLATTSNGRLIDGVRWGGVSASKELPAVFLANSTLQTVAPVSFSDTTNDATRRTYDELTFQGMADTYYTQVTVDPTNYAAQTESYGSAPYRLLTLNTYNASTADADALAALNLNLYSLPSLAPSSLSATSTGQHTQNLDTLGVTDGQLGELVMRYVTIAFRGTTYVAAIEGVSIEADPDETRMTYYFSPATYPGWLTLDDSTLGKLDSNRLAFTDVQ